MSSEGFGDTVFGETEFGDRRGDEGGFGSGGFGHGGFGGTDPNSEWIGLFGSSPFGAEPFGGKLVPVQPEPSGPATAPDVVKSVRPCGPPTVRDRFEAHIKSPFKTDAGSTWDKLLNTLGDEFEELHAARDEAMPSKYVDHATGDQLDKIGSFAQLPRKHEESDPHYRGRLKVQLRVLIGGGSIEDIKETAAILLQTQPREVHITEDPEEEAARFDISFPSEFLDESPVEIPDFVSFLDEVRAAGVRIFGTVEGGFEYRSEDDYHAGVNNVARSYNNGEYAGLLIG